jgi:hypothetical protein
MKTKILERKKEKRSTTTLFLFMPDNSKGKKFNKFL